MLVRSAAVERRRAYRVEVGAGVGGRLGGGHARRSPSAIPADAESTTTTRSSKSAAASRADSYVPESRADRCTETTPVGARVEQPPVRLGELGGRRAGRGHRDPPLAQRPGDVGRETSTPSRPSRPETVTVSGTTSSRAAADDGAGRYAVESVTTRTAMPAR